MFKQVWKSNLHHRFKMLLWAIASGVLPTKDSIGRSMSNVDLLCPLCGCWIESVIHLFCDCSLAKALWFRCLDTRTKLFDLTEPSDIVELILFPSDNLKDDPLYCDHFILTGTLILDQIWKARNFKIHDDGQIKVEKITKNIIILRFEHRLPPKQSSNSACHSYAIDKWVRPEFGVIKINCDAARDFIA